MGVDDFMESDGSIDSKAEKQLKIIKSSINSFFKIMFLIAFLINIVSFLVINQLWNFQEIATFNNQEQGLETAIKRQYENSIQYLEYVGRMSEIAYINNSMFSSYDLNSSTTETLYQLHRQKLYNTKGGMQCISGECFTLSSLKNIIWQYVQFSNLISSITICLNSSECVGVPIQGLSTVEGYLESLNFSQNITNAKKYQNKILITKEISGVKLIMELNQNIETHLPQFSESLKTLTISDSLGVMNITKSNSNSQQNQIIRKSSKVNIVDDNGEQLFEVYFDKVYTQTQTLNYLKLLYFSPLILFIVVYLKQRKYLLRWVHEIFGRKNLINKLYKFSLNEVFVGKKPVQSVVIGKGPMNQFYRILSELPDKSIQSIHEKSQTKNNGEPFKFKKIINQIAEKYKEYNGKLMESKNRQILNYRFNLQELINDISVSKSQQIKDYFFKVKAMDEKIKVQEFFQFAYLAILRDPENYYDFLQKDSTPLPESLLNCFRELNQTAHNTSALREKVSKIAENQNKKEDKEENKMEIEMRIKVLLIPKYLAILKDLDIQNYYMKKLNLEREVWALAQTIENKRYLLTRHNKNIRMFGK